jgi:predicted amidohydrolase YtcJ
LWIEIFRFWIPFKNLPVLKYLLYCWQPDHLLDNADSAGNKIGVERADRSSYTFRSLLDGGAQLAFGSDWPVRNSTDILVTELCFSVTI